MMLINEEEAKGPRLHALIIGIGGYDHLRGGFGTTFENLDDFGSPGQLTSPPRSALAMVSQITSPDLEWRVPVGSVDLLISPAPEDPDLGMMETYDVPTRNRIQTAFDEWWTRCNSHKDNIAIFYFAGHGTEGLRQIVLTSDFGDPNANPWDGAIDIDGTCEAMGANRAETQIIMIDACRSVTHANIENPAAPVRPLKQRGIRQRELAKYQLVIKSTQRNEEAKSQGSSVSYFTAALIKGLVGGASNLQNGEWWVSTGTLVEKISELLEIAGSSNQITQNKINFSSNLLKLNTAPTALLEMSCLPNHATAHARLSWTKGEKAKERGPQPTCDPWTLEVEPGSCRLSAIFLDQPFRNVLDHEAIVLPPRRRESLPVL